MQNSSSDYKNMFDDLNRKVSEYDKIHKEASKEVFNGFVKVLKDALEVFKNNCDYAMEKIEQGFSESGSEVTHEPRSLSISLPNVSERVISSGKELINYMQTWREKIIGAIIFEVTQKFANLEDVCREIYSFEGKLEGELRDGSIYQSEFEKVLGIFRQVTSEYRVSYAGRVKKIATLYDVAGGYDDLFQSAEEVVSRINSYKIFDFKEQLGKIISEMSKIVNANSISSDVTQKLQKIAQEKAEAERKAKEEEEKARKAEEERKAREEERRKAEEQERIAREKAEAERRAHEEAEKARKAEEERKAKEEEERRKAEEKKNFQGTELNDTGLNQGQSTEENGSQNTDANTEINNILSKADDMASDIKQKKFSIASIVASSCLGFAGVLFLPKIAVLIGLAVASLSAPVVTICVGAALLVASVVWFCNSRKSAEETGKDIDNYLRRKDVSTENKKKVTDRVEELGLGENFSNRIPNSEGRNMENCR